MCFCFPLWDLTAQVADLAGKLHVLEHVKRSSPNVEGLKEPLRIFRKGRDTGCVFSALQFSWDI